MHTITEIQDLLKNSDTLHTLSWLYCCDEAGALYAAERYSQVLSGLERTYGPHEKAALFSAPGRTEIGGNHTDHQHGCVLAAGVTMDMIAAVAENNLGTLRLMSEGCSPVEVSLSDLEKHPEEENTSTAILRGTAFACREHGAKLKGLDIYVASNVPRGSGISSSAAFEVLLGTILNDLCGGAFTPVELARLGQWVENVYFGKPCGLMDQMASSVGGVIFMDFADPAAPVVKPIGLNLDKAGLALCILDSGADHADLTDEYAAVPAECRAVAGICGGEVLGQVPYEVFLAKIPQCRKACGDRAVLRAIHFYGDNSRARQEAHALAAGDYDAFLDLVRESGHSSFEALQNVIPAGAVMRQNVALTILLARELLGGRGAVRVHGGGFAGTVQSFVPLDMLDRFRSGVETLLGEGTCHVMSIRPVGGFRLL